MKIQSSKETLSKGIQIVQNVVTSRITLPILSNILLESIKDGVSLTTTDLDISISSFVSANILGEGSITVPAKKFWDIIKELPDSEVIICAKKNNVLTIDCEKCSFKLMGLPKDEFPKLPQFKDELSISIGQELLKNMLNMTSFAMSNDETRYVLNGVLFVMKHNNIKLVATDGRRLALIERAINLPKNFEKEVIIPTKAISELIRVLKDEGEIKIIFSENQACFKLNNTTIISRLIEGEFPNYEQVIPKETKEKVLVNRERLLEATRRANLLTTQDSQSIKIDISKDKMVISKISPDIGELREEIDVDYKGVNFSIGFNPLYLIDVLRNIEQENINLEITSPQNPGVIRAPDKYIYIVLPMQLT